LDDLPDPDVLARQIVEELENAHEKFRGEIALDLGAETNEIEKRRDES